MGVGDSGGGWQLGVEHNQLDDVTNVEADGIHIQRAPHINEFVIGRNEL